MAVNEIMGQSFPKNSEPKPCDLRIRDTGLAYRKEEWRETRLDGDCWVMITEFPLTFDGLCDAQNSILGAYTDDIIYVNGEPRCKGGG